MKWILVEPNKEIVSRFVKYGIESVISIQNLTNDKVFHLLNTAEKGNICVHNDGNSSSIYMVPNHSYGGCEGTFYKCLKWLDDTDIKDIPNKVNIRFPNTIFTTRFTAERKNVRDDEYHIIYKNNILGLIRVSALYPTDKKVYSELSFPLCDINETGFWKNNTVVMFEDIKSDELEKSFEKASIIIDEISVLKNVKVGGIMENFRICIHPYSINRIDLLGKIDMLLGSE